MNQTVLVIAPHADDETLGCGGTILRHRAHGDVVHWLLVTDIQAGQPMGGITAEQRDVEVQALAARLGFAATHRLGLPPAGLDRLPLGDLVAAIGSVVQHVAPALVYLPFPGDIHSDHAAVFRAASGATKWFRYPSVQEIRLYETLSETNFGIDPTTIGFRPNLYVNIISYLEEKLAAFAIFGSEIKPPPFPRSMEAVRALALLRGSEAGLMAAEAFMIVKRIEA